MNISDIFEEWRFVLELLSAQLAFLLPFARRRKPFILRFSLGVICLLLLSLGYFPLRNFTLAASLPINFIILIWYITLILLTVPFERVCFPLTTSDALYFCIVSYAAQHIVYTLLHELLVRDVWTDLPSHMALYVVLTLVANALLFTAICFTFGPHLILFRGRLFNDNRHDKIVNGIMLAILVTCTFSCQHLFEVVEEERLVIVCLELLVCMLILAIQYTSLMAIRFGKDSIQMEQMLKDAASQYSLTNEMIDQINRISHDLKHTLQALKAMDESERQSYIEQAERHMETYHQLVHTADETLNTILGSKCLYCESKGIRLTCAVEETVSLAFLSIPDLSALLGNAIDNAVECVEQFAEPEKRVISLTIRSQGGFTCIQTNNICERKLTLQGGLPITTKANKQIHGFGLNSIRYLAEKYGGSACVGIEDNVFILQVMLPTG